MVVPQRYALHALFETSSCLKLPRPTKIKRRDVRNTTGVIGVARVREYPRSGGLRVRAGHHGPKRNGERAKAAFSVGLYGEEEAFRLAVAFRHAGLRELGDIS